MDQTVRVNAPEPLHIPHRWRRPDGTTQLLPADHITYTTTALLDAEDRLLTHGRDTDGPAVRIDVLSRMLARPVSGPSPRQLSLDQAVAVEKIATSRRRLDVLVGPAGTGKTTTLAGLRTVWETEHGPGSVVGLAPSAAAAEALATELGVDTENTAKWLHEHARNLRRRQQVGQLPVGHRRAGRLVEEIARWEFRPGQLVIVDEASLAGTLTLDALASASNDVGAKLLLAGDPYQLSAIDAGGMFRALVRDRGDRVAELSDVRRFSQAWEKEASVRLRVGDTAALDAYETHERITGGDRERILRLLYAAWRTDIEAGRSSLMIAGDTATVAELNQRAREDRIASGQVADEGIQLVDGSVAGVGDHVVTRENNRLLTADGRWVRNGDRWTVTATNQDGSMTVTRPHGGEVVLPTGYVAEHVELAYATTAHRAQGATVDTAHVLVSPTTTREALYVAATRGRHSNQLYVDTRWDPDPPTGHDPLTPTQTPRHVLAGVLVNQGAELSAHDQIRASHEAANRPRPAPRRVRHPRPVADEERWSELLGRSGVSPQQLGRVRSSPAYGALLAALRDAEAHGLGAEDALPALVAGRTLVRVDDPAAVLHSRIDDWKRRAGPHRGGHRDLVAGIIPRARGVSDSDLARAPEERDQAMERRAARLAAEAARTGVAWVRELGPPPGDPSRRAVWLHQLRVVAAYRDLWGITSRIPLGPIEDAGSIEQLGHRSRALHAARRAMVISRDSRVPAIDAARANVVATAREQEGVQR